MQSLRLLQLTIGIICISCIALYFLLTSEYAPIKIFQPTNIVEPIIAYPEFYDWPTNISSFPALENGIVADSKLDDICRHFPAHKLETIQPVLKTGHGVLERVRQSLRSTSACLNNLLFFSDLEEEVDGRLYYDVIADTPEKLLLGKAGFDQTLPYRQLKDLQANGTLNDTTMDKGQGWAADKFKFLPSIVRAWRMAPEKEWYVFYEGDSYIVWDTVFRLLEHFDPDEPHYFGSPSPGRDGIWFGYGGSGYILSREAVWRLVKDDWNRKAGEWRGSNKLIEKYWKLILEDCCGDSVAGYVLHDYGVNLKGLWPMFNPHALHGIPYSDLYWCQPVLSMHRSYYKEENSLWKWEWGARAANPQRPILYRDIAESFFNITSFTDVRENWENADWDGYEPAPDDPNDPHASLESCSQACQQDQGCFQWRYHLQRCVFVRSFRVGSPKDPGIEKEYEEEDWSPEDQKYTAGWNTARIRQWIDDHPCDQVQWVTPSTERVF